jgi:ketosteroid isomerase-like protein
MPAEAGQRRIGAHRHPDRTEATVSGTTTLTDALTIQRAMFAAVRRGDMKVLRELFHPDYTYTPSDGVERPGAEAGMEVAELYTTAFPDITIEEVRSWSPTPDVSIMEVRFAGTHTGPLGDIPPTGRRAEGMSCNILQARDGLIWREREYFDELSLLRQLGLAEG